MLSKVLLFEMQLSWEIFRGKPATRKFDESFATILRSDDWFARQDRFKLPPEVSLASFCPRI